MTMVAQNECETEEDIHSHDAVRANLDPPDFFEYLAENHGKVLLLREAAKNSIFINRFGKLVEIHVGD